MLLKIGQRQEHDDEGATTWLNGTGEIMLRSITIPDDRGAHSIYAALNTHFGLTRDPRQPGAPDDRRARSRFYGLRWEWARSDAAHMNSARAIFSSGEQYNAAIFRPFASTK